MPYTCSAGALPFVLFSTVLFFVILSIWLGDPFARPPCPCPSSPEETLASPLGYRGMGFP